jgi:DnaK suppressor protein
MKLDTKHFKAKLQEELAQVEAELKTVGRENPDSPGDWEARPDNIDILASDENEVADLAESLENNAGIMAQLELRLAEIKRALQKIEDGKYGICEVSGKPIPVERLEANPAARTLIEFADQIQ